MIDRLIEVLVSIGSWAITSFVDVLKVIFGIGIAIVLLGEAFKKM